MRRRILAVAASALAVAGCSGTNPVVPEPTTSTSPAPCTDPVFTWTGVQATPTLSAVGEVTEAASGADLELDLKPIGRLRDGVSGDMLIVEVDTPGVDPEVALTSLDAKLAADRIEKIDTVARNAEHTADTVSTTLTVTDVAAGRYVAYTASYVITARTTYTCAGEPSARTGSVATWSDLVTAVYDCASSPGTGPVGVVEAEVARFKCT
ncbi:hypothetical protein [Actinoplanes sp. NBRC 101535]|uniref:hypothetical protein n=1 Tax=Actinoplanes sp. NBRC 101535 TaxID=3032196 RepID=UPI0024A4854F|nr:hypothetical protein [Actinoplanes sp. NBRC 101535]GLY03741.1 hypothetical protein Acsp01_41200 [Actinoplanes sp. NBRC 101535]